MHEIIILNNTGSTLLKFLFYAELQYCEAWTSASDFHESLLIHLVGGEHCNAGTNFEFSTGRPLGGKHAE